MYDDVSIESERSEAVDQPDVGAHQVTVDLKHLVIIFTL
jgi:hypothetical protein